MGQNMEKKEIIELFLAITAKWCGACHTIRDRLLKAIKGSKRPATNVDESQMESVNSQLNADIKFPFVPYFIVIGKNGKIIKTLKTIEEVEGFLAQVPANEGAEAFLKNTSVTGSQSAMPSAMPSTLQALSGQTEDPESPSAQTENPESPSLSASNASALTQASIMTDESGLPTGIQLPSASEMSNSAKSNSAKSNSAKSNSAKSNSAKSNSAKSNSAKSNTSKSNFNKSSNSTSQNSPVSASSLSSQKLMSMAPLSGMAEMVAKGASVSNPNVTSATMTAIRPNSSQDRISAVPSSSSTSTKGGCLYASLASTAYQLAPPAVLLGIAAATLSKKRRSKRQTRRR